MMGGAVAGSSLPRHLESRLGQMVGGWSKDPGGEPMPFQVARFELDGRVIEGTSMTGLYATPPVSFDDAFAFCSFDEGTEAAIVWLVPVHASEAELVRARGWPAFEELLEQHDPDLFDPLRAPLALAR